MAAENILRKDVNAKDKCMCVLFQGGHNEHLSNPDIEQIKIQIGRYYNYFAKQSDDNDVVFTVPYNDSGGLGKHAATFLSHVQPWFHVKLKLF